MSDFNKNVTPEIEALTEICKDEYYSRGTTLIHIQLALSVSVTI